ncbi:MAG: sodium:solute symporter [Bacteroidia bacterium]
MDPQLTLLVIVVYFGLLFLISLFTGREVSEQTFFTANRNAPWFVVAFGMIGASLSGVTFISVPGKVGFDHWAYLQLVFGYLLGYVVIAQVLLPLYYRLNLTSIYGYLQERYGRRAYRSGALLFMLSRVIGSSLRLYIVALVLQLAICDYLGIPFPLTVLLSIALIFLYTFRGGIKTVLWTDTLQTVAMLAGAGIVVGLIVQRMDLSAGEALRLLADSEYTRVWVWDWAAGNHFVKQFFSGALITIVMTGLDQDMMQKNLTCRNLRDAQKNVYTFSAILVLANLLFLSLGALLYLYGEHTGLIEPVFEGACKFRVHTGGETICYDSTDKLFPLLSLQYLGPLAGIVFVLGVIAAAYSSADSALTALTTSFCVDLLDFERRDDTQRKLHQRRLVHVGFALLLFVVILVFRWINDQTVIDAIFIAAGYTYGPLLGLFTFGMASRRIVPDTVIPWLCLASPVLSYLIDLISARLGFSWGFLILLLNALLTLAGLWAFSKRAA